VNPQSAIHRSFSHHRADAIRRGITFDLTFEEWWQLWAPHWLRRGRNIGQKWMLPLAAEAGFVAGNVRIVTVTPAMRSRLNPSKPRSRLPSVGCIHWIGRRQIDHAEDCSSEG